VRGLLAAIWSFLQRPAGAVETRVAAAEETVERLERHLEDDFKRAIRARAARIEAELESVKTRVVEDLKHELRRVVFILAIAAACGSLAVIAAVFGLMALWAALRNSIGSVEASLVLTIAFLLASLLAFGLLRAFLGRSHTACPSHPLI
jgi:hypothetical protein